MIEIIQLIELVEQLKANPNKHDVQECQKVFYLINIFLGPFGLDPRIRANKLANKSECSVRDMFKNRRTLERE